MVENEDEAAMNRVLNAHFMCKEYGGRPSDDLLGDALEFSLNSFVRSVGVAYENEQHYKNQHEEK